MVCARLETEQTSKPGISSRSQSRQAEIIGGIISPLAVTHTASATVQTSYASTRITAKTNNRGSKPRLSWRDDAIADLVIRAIISISVLVFAAKLLGEFFHSIKLPQVLGELFAGIIFGPYALGSNIVIFNQPLVAFNEIVQGFAEIGGIIILFIAGLSITFAQFRASGAASLTVGSIGVALPFLLGYGVYLFYGYPSHTAMIVGAALTATSIAITVRTLEGVGRIYDPESQIMINAAVIDDVLALAVLSIVVSVIGGGVAFTPIGIGTTLLKTLLIWFLLLAIGVAVIPRFIDRSALLSVEGSVEAMAISICFAAAALAAALGLSPIVGAFAAGMAIASSKAHARVKEFSRHLSLVFSPIFFGVTGAYLNLSGLDANMIIVTTGLVVVAVVGKLVGCGLPSYIFLRDKIKSLRVGVGMISRGEVGLIIAGIGVSANAITGEIYAQVIGMIIATTILTPILLEYSFTKIRSRNEPIATP